MSCVHMTVRRYVNPKTVRVKLDWKWKSVVGHIGYKFKTTLRLISLFIMYFYSADNVLVNLFTMMPVDLTRDPPMDCALPFEIWLHVKVGVGNDLLQLSDVPDIWWTYCWCLSSCLEVPNTERKIMSLRASSVCVNACVHARMFYASCLWNIHTPSLGFGNGDRAVNNGLFGRQICYAR
jgi:hypothetical protein